MNATTWGQFPVDQYSQLLDPAHAATAGIEDVPVRPGCGRLIPRSGLTIDGPPVGFYAVLEIAR
ncbi:MAG: hypothetical protein ACRDRX_22265 [Pseudonocardiaceae bacterium]